MAASWARNLTSMSAEISDATLLFSSNNVWKPLAPGDFTITSDATIALHIAHKMQYQ